jgi:hypothetical protein
MRQNDESFVQAMIDYVEAQRLVSGSSTFKLDVSGVFPEYRDSEQGETLREATFRIRASPTQLAGLDSSDVFFLSYTFSPDRSRRDLQRDFRDFLRQDVPHFIQSVGGAVLEVEGRAIEKPRWRWATQAIPLGVLISAYYVLLNVFPFSGSWQDVVHILYGLMAWGSGRIFEAHTRDDSSSSQSKTNLRN